MNEARQVRGDQSVKILCRVIGERLHHEDAGVRDYGIDGAELLQRESRNFLRGLKLTYVTVDQGKVIGR